MKKYIIFILFIFLFSSCKKLLDEQVYAQLGPSNFYNNADDAEALLNGVYTQAQGYRDLVRDRLAFNAMTTDIFWESGGSINTQCQPMIDFTWDATHPWLHGFWNRAYADIYKANIVLDKVPAIPMNEDRKAQILAEARFLRAVNYFDLYNLFGPVPLITTSAVSATDRPSRATQEECLTFIATELTAVSQVLPPTQEQFYRATSGAALAFLCKLQLNNHQWQQAAETADKIIKSGVYHLFTEGKRTALFALSNEENKAFIWSIPFMVKGVGSGNTYYSHAVPPDYLFQYPPKVNFAAQIKVRTAFVNTFEPGDERLEAFLFSYENTAHKTIALGKDDIRDFKYPEDPDGIGDVSGNDFPVLRYADILMSRAEALNALNGPNQQSIDLLNEVRQAAGLGPLSLADFPDTESLNTYILKARGWEFHGEGKRRIDLIRMGKFIEQAQARGKQAFDYQLLFPIPQGEIDKNANLKQNPGYE